MAHEDTQYVPSADAGKRLFADGLSIKNAERFRDLAAAHNPDEDPEEWTRREDARRAYFTYEIDSLRLYQQSVANIARTCPSCGAASLFEDGSPSYRGPWRCLACGRRDENKT